MFYNKLNLNARSIINEVLYLNEDNFQDLFFVPTSMSSIASISSRAILDFLPKQKQRIVCDSTSTQLLASVNGRQN